MKLLNQKLGTVGDIHASIVDGKLVIGVDGDIDLVAQLEKLKSGHQADFLGAVLSAAEGGLKALSASKPAVAAPSA